MNTPPPYTTLWAHLAAIPGTVGARIRTLYETEWARIASAPGSAVAHQAWTSPPHTMGGYVGHITECLNLAVLMYATLTQCRPVDFTLDDLRIVLALHDIEKPWRYSPEPSLAKGSKEDRSQFRQALFSEYGIELTALQHNGLRYVEGEFDYVPGERRASPLAAVAHTIDMISARVWPDAPFLDDPWAGAAAAGRAAASPPAGATPPYTEESLPS